MTVLRHHTAVGLLDASGVTTVRNVSATVDLEAIGARIRAARERKGFTLDQVSSLSSISKAHLSRLEAGDRQASIGTLVELADALDVRVSALLGEDTTVDGTSQPSGLAIYAADAPSRASGELDIAAFGGFPGSRALEALRVHISAGRRARTPVTHRGEEWLYVVTGRLTFEFDAVSYDVPAGSAVHFDATHPHRLGADVDTELLLVSAIDRATLSQIRH